MPNPTLKEVIERCEDQVTRANNAGHNFWNISVSDLSILINAARERENLIDNLLEFGRPHGSDHFGNACGCDWCEWFDSKKAKAISEPKHPISEAPKDGSSILGIYDDGAEIEIRWSEQRRCMLAGIGGGNGFYGPGWEDCENKLIVDEPKFWKPFPSILSPPHINTSSLEGGDEKMQIGSKHKPLSREEELTSPEPETVGSRGDSRLNIEVERDALQKELEYISEQLCGVKVENDVKHSDVYFFVEGKLQEQSELRSKTESELSTLRSQNERLIGAMEKLRLELTPRSFSNDKEYEAVQQFLEQIAKEAIEGSHTA
jgi:hypothetical protein